VDSDGAAARGCVRHAVAALDGMTDAHVRWADSKSLNEWERKALELCEERSNLTTAWVLRTATPGAGLLAGDGRRVVVDGLSADVPVPHAQDIDERGVDRRARARRRRTVQRIGNDRHAVAKAEDASILDR